METRWSRCLRHLATCAAGTSVVILIGLIVAGGQAATSAASSLIPRALGLPYGQERLWYAIETRDCAQIDRALAEGGSLNLVNEFSFGNTPLIMAAATADDPRLVRELLLRGADPDLPNELGMTPLLSAIYADHVEAVEVLLQAGADPNTAAAAPPVEALRALPRTPLICAARVGNPRVVELLIAAGADPNEWVQDTESQ